MNQYFLPTIITLAFFVVVLALMWWGWSARKRRDSASVPYPHPATTAPATLTSDAFYVSTTRHEQPMERFAIRGLGFRGRATVAIGPDGVELAIPGGEPIWIPAAAVRAAGPATLTIDRVVEKGGLICLSWQLDGDGPIADSYLRITEVDDRARVLAALDALALTSSDSPTSTTESEA